MSNSAPRHSTLCVRVQPRASRNAIVGWTGDTLKLKLTAPPIEGAANDACLTFLSRLLDVPASHLSLLVGERSRTKLIRITGLTHEQVQARLRAKEAVIRPQARRDPPSPQH
jgi:hypothetical protein